MALGAGCAAKAGGQGTFLGLPWFGSGAEPVRRRKLSGG